MSSPRCALPVSAASVVLLLVLGCGSDGHSGADSGTDTGGQSSSASVPCTPAERCRADMVEWPMPGSRPQGKLAPFAYEGLDASERETVLDKITLLEWQRDPPFAQRLTVAQAQGYNRHELRTVSSEAAQRSSV